MKTLSLVVPMYNERAAVVPLLEAVDRVCAKLPQYLVEVVCVNDGSADDTLAELQAAQATRRGLVVVDLSRNFGKEAALSAGLSVATGDAVIPMDADLQDPPALIVEMVAKWEEGYEVVVAHRRDRSADSLLKRASATLFYRVHNLMSDVKIPPHVGDYRLMDRVAVDVLNALPENRRFMKGLFAWAGFRTAAVEYDRAPRASGHTTFNAWRLWNLAVEGITSFSLLPLRIWTYVGACVALVSLVYGSWIVVRTLLHGKDVPGYASIIVAILFLGGLQLIGIGIIGEYLGRNYLESKRRPPYVIRKVLRGSQ
ncbi:MAG TPA: glycosyltransferase family 2 protein [Usitatibacter sp.]|jgi:glycosyltransferase involved in cell wall biosynthesis|nr:glycosyltransferase family 2 protein [Usitatibacter sp.]